MNLSNIAFPITINDGYPWRADRSLYWGNPLVKTLTDTVPVLVTALNVALLNRERLL